jgi:rsbT antagonist protein RsbS
MADVTIMQLKDTIIVPIQVELHDTSAQKLQEDILYKIERTDASGLVIDVSGISIVDSFLGRLLGETARMAKLMGVETVLVGMRKEVVITLIQLGLVLKDLQTALNIEDGLERLEKLKAQHGSSRGRPVDGHSITA